MEYSEHTQDDLRIKLSRQWRDDMSILITQGRYPPPWVNEDFSIQADEGRLLSSIADNCGVQWHSGSATICRNVANMLGMSAIGNAKATVKRCIQLGYVKARYDRDYCLIMLDLTDLGAAMLELWEDENSLMMESYGKS